MNAQYVHGVSFKWAPAAGGDVSCPMLEGVTANRTVRVILPVLCLPSCSSANLTIFDQPLFCDSLVKTCDPSGISRVDEFGLQQSYALLPSGLRAAIMGCEHCVFVPLTEA
jgi:hypothetical protein